MLDEKLFDRARRLIETQFEERRKIFQKEISRLMREMQVKHSLHSSATLNGIHEICVQEVAKRTKIVLESILRAHKAIGSPLTETLAADIKQEVQSFIGDITKEINEKMVSEMRFMKQDARHYNLDDARNGEIQKVNIEADLYVDSLGQESKNLKSVNIGTKAIFISHANEDAVLAENIKAQIDNVFGNKVDVFVSSIHGLIPPGSDWFNKIIDNLTENNAFIVLVTPYSEKRPFVWFEIGFSWLRRIGKNCEIYAICVPPIKPGNLSEPLCRLQAISLADKKQTEAFFNAIVNQFNCGDTSVLDFQKILKTIPDYNEWVSDQVPVVRQIADSPSYQFKYLLSQTNKSIFLVGQSLFHLTNKDNQQEYENLIFKALAEKYINIRIMLSDPDCTHAVQTWSIITGGRYEEDVRDAIDVLKNWMQRYSQNKDQLKGGLQIKKTILAPVTATFVDQEDDSGKMCLTPVIDRISSFRPSYIVFKNRYPDIFAHYWGVYNELYSDKNKTKSI